MSPCHKQQEKVSRRQPAGLRATGGNHKGETALETAEERGEAEVAIVLGARLSEAEKAAWGERKAAIAAEPDDY